MLKKENPSGFYVDPVLSRFCPGTKRKNGIINCKSINYSVCSCGDPTRTNDLDAVKEVVYRNGTLRANFFRDIWRVEKVRKKFDAKEMVLFKGVLQEGKDKGVFCIDDVDMTASLVHYCVKGIEVPYIRGHIGANLDMETRKRYVANIVFGALHRTEI